MSDHELKVLLEEFLTKGERKIQKRHDWYLAIFSTLALSFFALIFYMGSTYKDIEHLKSNAIQKASEEWTQNDYRTNASYFKVFKIPPEYQIRGGQTN